MFRHNETSLAPRRCLTHHLHETSLVPILPARIRRHGYFVLGTGRRLPSSVLEDGCVLASSVIEVRAMLPSPYGAERSSPKATTPWPFARFLGMLLFRLPFGIG